MDFKHYSISDVGRVRQANEDSCGDRMTANGYVFVVCDGMGGHVGGATASKIAVESILEFLENPVQNIYVGINDALKYANSQVFSAALQDPSLKGMGTTATVLVVNNEACFIGHVGDSRIYLKSDGKLNRLTKDHSFVQTLVDQGIISDDDAESHPKKNQILEALGIKADVAPTVCQAPIHPKPGDCFLLCSDGLNGMIRDPEIEAFINPENVENSCRLLIASANESGGNDNITATLVSITESPYSHSVFTHFNPEPVQSETVIEPIAEQPTGRENRRQRFVLWGGIGFGAAMLAIFLIFVLPRMMDGDEKQVPIVDPPTITERDSACVSLDSIYHAFKSEDGAQLFKENATFYRYDSDTKKFQKRLTNGDWDPNWEHDKGKMEQRYKEILKVFENCREIIKELPTRPNDQVNGASTNTGGTNTGGTNTGGTNTGGTNTGDTIPEDTIPEDTIPEDTIPKDTIL